MKGTHTLWSDAWERLRIDRLAVVAMGIIGFYALVALAAKLGAGSSWNETIGAANLAPGQAWAAAGWKGLLGTDFFGRSVLLKVIQGTRIAMSVGVVTAAIAIPIGVVLGAVAGYFGGLVDDIVVWLYTTLSSIPGIMLLIAFTYVLGKGIVAVYIALGMTSWVTLARLIRGEVMKHKEREYVLAAESLGAGHLSKIFRHILPNVVHIVIINLSLQFQIAIKTEVILSYLGIGVQGQPSWGVMIDDARQTLQQGVWWELAGATAAMFFVVLAFNLLGDALRDALDPKVASRI